MARQELEKDIEQIMPLAPDTHTHQYNGVEIITQYFPQPRPANPKMTLGWSYNVRFKGKVLFCAWCAGRYYGDSEDHALNIAHGLIDRMGWPL